MEIEKLKWQELISYFHPGLHYILSPPIVFTWNFPFFFCIQALKEYKAELQDDPIISTHLTKLYDNLLEQNLIRVIEPFSRVQVMPRSTLVSTDICLNTLYTFFSYANRLNTFLS